ncbi:MAG: ABC transporter permease [Alistipes sp.]|nr:ABC transporter permease [Alistipes sp.]
MALNLKYLIAARYVRSPKSHSVINIISGVSVVAMAVPVAAIILLLSIFNGLERMTGDLYNAVDADLKVTPATGTTFMVEAIDTTSLRDADYVAAFSLQLEQSALAEHDGRQSLISVKGVEQTIQDVISIREHLRAGTFNTEFDENDCLVLAHGVAHELGLLNQNAVGEQVSLYAINRKRLSTLLPIGGYTRIELPMVGIYAIDQDNSSMAYTSLRAAQRLFNYPDRASSVEVRLLPDANIKRAKRELQQLVGDEFRVQTRYESNSIYRLMALEKWGVFIIAMVVMAVASLSIVGTLVMVIIDKRDDIATLRTLGAKPALIRGIFIGEGRLMTAISLGVGLMLGVGLTLAQQIFGFVRLNTATLIIDAYPIELQLLDIILTVVAYLAIAWIIITMTVRQTLKSNAYEKAV